MPPQSNGLVAVIGGPPKGPNPAVVPPSWVCNCSLRLHNAASMAPHSVATIQLEWATFQIMRRTHASLSRQAGIDPKLVADQLGHGLGVNLDVYTVAALHKRQDAVEMLESALARRGPD